MITRVEVEQMIANLSPEARARCSPHTLSYIKRTLTVPFDADEIMDRTPCWMEKDEQRECWRALLQYGFKVWWLSQPKRSYQTPGIPDLLARHGERGIILWVEVKRPTNPAPWTEAQQDFAAHCIEGKETYLVGGEGKLRAWLQVQFNTTEIPATMTGIQLPPNGEITDCEGHQKLLAAIQSDTKCGRTEAERMKTLSFAVERARHYEAMTGVSAAALLTAWESRRKYSYMNYYRDSNQPEIGKGVRVFETQADLMQAIGGAGFRCPYCKGVSRSPHTCDSGVMVELINQEKKKKEVCNWKSGGLFGCLGKGAYAFVKEVLMGDHFFMPIAWEAAAEAPDAS